MTDRFEGSERLSLFDRVRIRGSSQSESTGLAGRLGTLYGWTTPSVTGVTVVGSGVDDFAFGVKLDGDDEATWFGSDVVEFAERPAGQTIVIRDATYVQSEDGEWARADGRRRGIARRLRRLLG